MRFIFIAACLFNPPPTPHPASRRRSWRGFRSRTVQFDRQDFHLRCHQLHWRARMKLTESHGREESPLEKSAKPVALRCSAGLNLSLREARLAMLLESVIGGMFWIGD